MANAEINDLTPKTTPVSTDEVEIQETGGGTSKKATLGNLKNGLGLVKGDVGLGNVDNTSDATKKSDIIGTIYPVGSLYTSTLSTNPGTLLGVGTWVAFGEGRVMVGKAPSGTFGTAGATGGAETHTLSSAEMPSHSHDFASTGVLVAGGATYGVRSTSGTAFNTNTTGSGGAHNNLQPYIVVYMWQRSA